MSRHTTLALSLLLVTMLPNARGQNADEVKRLKERVELLETKLKQAEREIQDLQQENAKLKAGGAIAAAPIVKDGFAVGTKFKGSDYWSMTVNGQKVPASADAELEVTK